ncbi:MAG: hypothetical protein RL160_1532 [Bacteroidota bacterium]
MGAVAVQAQKTELFSGAAVHYRLGEELFNNGKWNASVTEFAQYLANGTDVQMRADAQYYVAIAKLRAAHSDGEAGVLEYLRNHPGSYKNNNANLALGDYYFMQGKFSRALPYYKQADPSAIAAGERDRLRFHMGYCQVMGRRYEDAKATLEPLVKSNSEYEMRATYYYGYACYYTGDYQKALESFRSIEDSGPQSLRFFMAQIYYLKGDYQKAIGYLEKSTAASFRSRSQFLKGKCHYRINEFELAADAFNRSGFTPDSIDRQETYEVGYTYFKVRQYNDAVLWLQLIANNGDSLAQTASHNLAEAFLKLGRKQDAYNAFFEAQRSDFNKKVQENAMLNYAKLAVELGFSKVAINYLQKFTAQFPQSPDRREAQKILATLFLSSDDYRTAISILESIGELDETARETYQKVTLYQGQKYFRDRDLEAALQMFNKSLLGGSDRKIQGEASFWKAEILHARGAYADALASYQRFAETPECKNLSYFPMVYYGMGYCRFRERRFAEASVYFNQYRNAARSGNYREDIYTDAMARLGDSYFMIRKLPEALESYAYVSGKKGTGADYALFQKGMIYGFTRESQQKIATMKRIPNEFPESPFVPDAIFEMASEQLNIGQAKDAERNLMYLVQDFQGRLIVKKAYQTLGQLYYKQEKDEKSIDMYKKLALEYPGTPEAQKAIEKIEKIYRENGRGAEYLSWIATVPNVSVSASRRDSIVYTSAYNLWERKDYEGAIREFNRYLSDYRDGFFRIPAQYHLAYSYERKKQPDLALPFYQKVADAAASEFSEQSLLAVVDIMSKNMNNCPALIPYLEKLEQQTTSRDNLLYAVHKQMRCALSINQGSTVERKAEQLLELDYTKPEMISEALLVLGRIRMEQGNYAKALELFQRNFNKFDNQFAAESKYHEALTLFTMDSLAAAKKSVFQYNNQFSGYDLWLAKSFLLLGDIYVKMGDQFSAKATWNSVIANFNDMPDIIAEARRKLDGLNQLAPKQDESGGGE